MSAAHFNWTQLVPEVGHNVHVATAIVVTGGLAVMSVVGRASLGTGEKSIRPATRFSVRGFFELVIEMINNIADMVIGHDGRKYAPMFSAIFTFVLFNNLVGLLPGMTAATDNLNTTFAVGVFSFLAYNIFGIREHGIVAYVKHFMGPLLVFAPLIFAIEIISHCVRPLSLGLRLMGNMTGDHTVLGIFLDMVPAYIPVPVIFYGLGFFVCVLQAFVFTLLSMVYVSMAIAHEH